MTGYGNQGDTVDVGIAVLESGEEAGVPEPPADLPEVAQLDDYLEAGVRAIQQRLAALDARRPGRGLDL